MSGVDQARFRSVLGAFPTGVTVVAGMDGEDPVGLVIGSFFSVSLDPPLVGFCVDKDSRSWSRMARSDSFCVNVLGADQEDVSVTFAMSGDDKFAATAWSPVGSGSPWIHGVLAWIDCDIDAVYEGGDHDIVVGRVRELALERDGSPLVFFRGRYRGLDIVG